MVSSGAQVEAAGAGVQRVWSGGAERTAPLWTADRPAPLKRRRVFDSLVLFAVDLVLFWIFFGFLSVVVLPRCLFVLYN